MDVVVITSESPVTLGRRIRLLRVARGWRQCDLAYAAQTPERIVSEAERDIPVSKPALGRICGVLGIDRELVEA